MEHAVRRSWEAGRTVLDQPIDSGIHEVLVQRAAKGHVRHLHPPADGERRQLQLDGRPRQRHLDLVVLPVHAVGLRMRSLAEQLGVNVGAAHQDEAVEATQQRHRRAMVEVLGGEDDRLRSGTHHSVEVGPAGKGHRVARHLARRTDPPADGDERLHRCAG